jgi:hypothetical protein
MENSKIKFNRDEQVTEHITYTYKLKSVDGKVTIFFKETPIAREDLTIETLIDYVKSNIEFSNVYFDGITYSKRSTKSLNMQKIMNIRYFDQDQHDEYQNIEDEEYIPMIIKRHFA